MSQRNAGRARYGTLTRLTVSDFNPDAGTVAIRTSRKSNPFHVVLTDEGARFFRQVCAGRPGGEVHAAISAICSSCGTSDPLN